jgi:hypothetical protein
MLFYALTLLSAVMALPQPLPALGPLDEHPTLTTVNFGTSSFSTLHHAIELTI